MADMTDLPDGDDELDIDGLDDINFDSPEFGGEDNRDPITRFKAAAVDSALDPDTYVGVTRAIAKNALPREYSEAYNSVEDTLKFITDTGRETADKVKKPINDLRDFVTDTIEEMDDSGNETIEKIKKTVLGLTSREREGSDEHTKQRDYDSEAITATLGSIFDGQKAQLEGMRSKDKQDRLSSKLNRARDNAHLEFSGLTNQLLARMVGYQDSILFEYQKKDLELQHRQYYALRDILSAVRGGLVTQSEANAAIVKNTGLPDWKKSTIGEDYKSEAFNKIYGNVNETVGQYNEKFFGRFKDNIKAKIDSGVEDFAAGVTQGLDAAQQTRDLTDGMDPFAMAGSIGTPIVLESLAGRLGKKFASKIAKYPSIANIADDLGYFLANSPQEVTDFMKNWDGKPFPGWLLEKYPFLDRVNARMIADQLQELMPGLANQQLTMTNSLHQTAMEEVGWDVMSRKSLVEIIPGYLSRLLEQATIANGGSGRTVYSAQQEAFVDLNTAIDSTKGALFTDVQTRRQRALDDAVSSVKGAELSDEVKSKLGKIMLARTLRNEPFRAERIIDDTSWTDEEREQVTEFFTKGEENPRLLRRMFTDAMKEMARGQDDMQKFINQTYATGGGDILIASGLVKEDKTGQREMLTRENKDKFLAKLYENRKKVRNKVSIGSLDELFALVEGVDPDVVAKIKEFIRQDKKVLKEVVKLADEEDPRKIIAKFNELEDRLTKTSRKFVFDNDMVSDIMFGNGNDASMYGQSRGPESIVTPRMFGDISNAAKAGSKFAQDKFNGFTSGAKAKADSIRTSPWVMQLMRAMRDKDIETLKKLITDEQNITFLKSKFKESRVNSLIKRAEAFIHSHEAQLNKAKDAVTGKADELAAFAEDKIGKQRIRRVKASGRLAKRKGKRLRGAAEEKLAEISNPQWMADAKDAVEHRDLDKLKELITDNEVINNLKETVDNTTVDDVVDRLKNTVKEQTEFAKEKYESSGAKEQVDSLLADAQDKYEVSGAKARVDEGYKTTKELMDETIANGKKKFDKEAWNETFLYNQELIRKKSEEARLWREELAAKAQEKVERVKPKRFRADRKEPTFEAPEEELGEEQDVNAVNEVNRLVEYTLRQDFIEIEGKQGLPVHVLSMPGGLKGDADPTSSGTELIDMLRGNFSEVSQILAMIAYNTDQIAKGTGDGKSKGSLFARLMGKVESGARKTAGVIPRILTSYFSGVTKMASAGLGIGSAVIKGGISTAGSVGSFLLMRDKIRDIYVKGKDAPVLFADRLKMGQYFDVATGKKIKRIKDIKGPVRDMDGNIVLTQDDIAAGLYNPYSKLDLSVGGLIGGVSKLFGKAMSLNFKVMKKLVTVPAKFLIGSDYLLKSAGDVYVKGEDTPRLTKFIMMRGGYFDAGSGDQIKIIGDIKGEVKDNQGNVLLSNEDIRKGLVDKNGRAINSSRLMNIIKGAFGLGGKLVMGVGRVGLKMAGAGLKAGATIAKAAGGLASNLMPWNWSKWGSKSNDMMASEEAVSTLKSILQLLDERLQKPKRKMFGDSDGDGDRDGSLSDLMGKRGKNKRPVKVKVPEEGEKKESAWSKILGVLGPLGMILGAGFSAVTSAVAGAGSLLFGAIGTIASGIAAVLGPIITSGLGAVAGLLGKVVKAISAARAASTAGDMFDDMTDVDGPDGDKKNKNGKGRGKGKGMGRASGKARGFFGRMVDGAKELGGKAADGMRGAKDAVVDKGGKAARAVKGQAGRAAKYVDGQVVKQVAKVAAGQAAKKAAVAGAGAGAAAVAASGALGAAAIAAAPIIATGVAVAGTAYTGYEIGNWAWKKWADVEELERLRFLQYGINPDDQDQVQMVRSLEEEFVDEVSWRNNTSPEFKLSPSEALEMWAENMGVDIMIQAHAEEWVTWFSKRFYPIVMNHLIACKNLGDINLDDVDDEIDEKRIPSYLSSVTVKYRYREKNDPFSVVASPFPGYFVQTNELAIAAYTDNLFTKYGIANPVSMESLVPKSSKETDGKQETDKVLEYEAAKALPKNAETSVTREVDKAKLDTIDPQPSQLETGQLAAKEEPRFNKPDPATAPVQIPPAPEEPPKVKLPDTATPAANPSGSGMVKYMRPCKGPITSPYGMRVHPIKKVQKMHKGIDIGAPGGTPIYASAAGTVFRADYSNSYGNIVYIRHANGWSTRYAHMQKFGPGISTGVQVQQGQLIGYVGNTGASKGNHLHFEMRTGSNYDSPTVDPAQYIGAASEIKAIEASVKLEDGATMDGSIEGFNTFTGAPESMQPTDKVLTVGGRTIVIKNEQNEETFDPSHNIDNVNRGTVDPSRDAPVNQTYDNVKSINNSSAPNVPSAGGDGSGYVPNYTGVPGFDRTPGVSSSSTDREFGSYEPVSTPRVPTPESNAGFNTQMQQMERVTEDEHIKHLRTMANGITRLVTIAEQLSTNMGKPPAPPRETARGVNTNTSAAPAAPAAKGGPSNGGMGRGSTNIKPPVDVSSR